ncbi:Glucose-6-phosphate isomerase [Spirochaeta thermophila DSM 6578]|uniref:Glucose-6-phosphate isomerase n=1 Tax=Winmispira thermophila (strain ATCC 700085 / DSM 6578 / Z-1203) TaxID=869211 RepID=G0GEH7_WINT7|nr:glucose-6-phosphate isomerase [Spirochaeta thermophila]AEJ62314.1 Glucose-6-phosphate isomerase [Spirochaeta thermophila DSM 6578]
MGSISYRNLDQCESFHALLKEKGGASLREVLTPERVGSYQVPAGGGLFYNYAAKAVDERILSLLSDLAKEQQLLEKYRALLAGEVMNTGEKRKVLHHLQRGELAGPVVHEGVNLREFYVEQHEKAFEFARKVHEGVVRGPSGAPFTTVVQIGIGGSDLGPRALYYALEGYVRATKGALPMEARFISNVDPDDAAAVLSSIDPARTLFILVSKSGTTQETLTNAALVSSFLREKGITEPKRQMVVVTSKTSPLAQDPDYLAGFYIDDFIGGRYSATSPVGGVVLSLALGPEVFQELLAGAHEADRSALEPDPRKNAAMLDALIGVYERNVLNHPATAILPYSQALHRFPAHLQQLDMESNGKRVNRWGEPVAYPTGPIIFGEPGTNGQHSFYQLLHQGTDIVPLQFIGFVEGQTGFDREIDGSTSQQKLNANLAAQIVAFAKGKDAEDQNKHFPGGRPSSLLYGGRLTPRTAGALLAHYENKVMFQGFLWNINSFDQEGVQLGKVLTKEVLAGTPTDPVLTAYARILGVRRS